MTSDFTLQQMVMASGAERVPVRELIQDMEANVKKLSYDKKKVAQTGGLNSVIF